MKLQSTYRSTWYGPRYIEGIKGAVYASVEEANDAALTWVQQESVVVTGAYQEGWKAIGPIETEKGVGGGLYNDATDRQYVEQGWSGFPGYHLGQQAMDLFYSDMLSRIKGKL